MADENIVTPPATEAEGSKAPETERPEPQESPPAAPESESEDSGSEKAERYEDEGEEKKPDSVPLHVHTQTRDKLKAEIRELREQLKNSAPSTAKLSEIASQWGVDPSTVKELAEAIKTESTKEIESRFKDLQEEQKRRRVDEAFEKDFQKRVAKNYPQLAGKKEQIKALAFTKQYANTPLDKIAEEAFGDLLGKSTQEEARPSSDKGGEVIDFAKPMTREQKAQVLKDPATRKKYYDFIDKHNPLRK